MSSPLVRIIAVIGVAGVFGGIVNYYLGKPDEVPPPNLGRSVVVGLAASFLVPLFLNMISSNLIDQIRSGDNGKLLILAGFCLVAAISSTAFIRTLSDRVLTEAKQAKREAQEAKAQVSRVRRDLEPIVIKETEADDTPLVQTTRATPETDEERLLAALAGGRWALRTQGGLARETGMDADNVSRLLDVLRDRGFVGNQTDENGTRWFITARGRDSLGRAG